MPTQRGLYGPGSFISDTAGWLTDQIHALFRTFDAVTAALGLKADQTALDAESAARAAAVTAEAAARTAADALRIPLTQKAAANGVATLGADSKIPGAQLPSLAIGETFIALNQAAMLALTAQRGDMAVRTDLNPDGFFLLTSDSPGTLADWVQVTAPGAVVSVDGLTGAVDLSVTYVDKATLTEDTVLGALVDGTPIALTGAQVADLIPTGNFAKPAVSTDAVLWALASGSDANTGLSYGEAKATIIAAWNALPAAGGTIFVGDLVDVGGPVLDQGLWIIGPNDPDYAAPPSGWVRQKTGAVSFVGVGTKSTGGNSPGGGVVAINNEGSLDPTKPGLWVSGTTMPLSFTQCGFLNRACSFRAGVSHAGDRDIETSRVYFDRCALKTLQDPACGPTVDLGYAYWITFDHADVNAYAGASVLSDQRAAILCKPDVGGRTGGLLSISNPNFAGGGLVYYCGETQWGFRVQDGLLEAGGAASLPPVVQIKEAHAAGGALIEKVSRADAGLTGADVSVDTTGAAGAAADSDNVVCIDVPSVSGPATIIGSGGAGVWDTATATPASQRQVGFYQGRMVGQHDSARRGFSPSTIRFANIAAQNTSTWGVLTGTATVTTGVTAPDGTTGAAKLSSGGGTLDRQPFRSTLPLSVGDFLIGGVWAKAETAGAPLGTPIQVSLITAGFEFVGGLTGFTVGMPLAGDGEWHWLPVIAQIGAIGSNPCDTAFSLRCDATHAMNYYAPMFFKVTGVGTNEAYEIAQHLAVWPDGAPAGAVSLLRGQDFHVPDGDIIITGDVIITGKPQSLGSLAGYILADRGSGVQWQNYVSGARWRIFDGALQPIAVDGTGGGRIRLGNGEDVDIGRGGPGFGYFPVLVKAGPISDADFATTPPDSSFAINISAAAGSKLACRIAGVWTPIA